MGILRVSNSFNFEKKIKSFCQPPRYEIDEISDEVAFISMEHLSESEAIAPHLLTLHNFPDMVRFNMPSLIVVPNADEVPHKLSTMLLNVNAESMLGFWCLGETEDDQFVFAYSCHVPKISLNKKLFDETVAILLSNCNRLYQIIDPSAQDADIAQDSQP